MGRLRTNGKSYWCTFQLSSHLEDENKRRTEGDYDHNELQVLGVLVRVSRTGEVSSRPEGK